MREIVHVDERKWPRRLHWQFDAQRLGEDEHGAWLYVARSTIARRGHEAPKPLEYGFVVCAPPSAWWLVECYWDHPRIELYVNIGTPPVWAGTRLSHVDLDLDVIRHRDGTVAIMDEDEFLDHQRRFAYPADLIDGARAAADLAVDMLRRAEEPFGSAARHWLEVAGHG